jgi:phenylacetate-CoA ligase
MDQAALTTLQLSRLREMLQAILPVNPFYQRKLSAIDPTQLLSLADLRRLPFTTKDELLADQAAHPPYGTNLTYPLTRYCRLHQTSGTATGQPLRWLDTPESWQWFLECWRLKYEVIGLKPEDRLFFPFSFGPFIGFWAAFEGAVRLGNLCLPGGGMSSAARLRFMLDNSATVVCCTPTYALRLAEVAQREGIDLAGSPVRILIVAGEPGGSIPATRSRIEQAWGARVFDHSGMTEMGSCTIECQENPGGVHVLETEFIPEVIDAATGEPVGAGQEGELVLTNLGRWGSPLIRYRTGDRVVADPSPCPCGRSWLRLQGGILGRTDDMMVIRGNNVYPSALENIIRRFPAVEEFSIEVADTGALTSLRLLLECQPAAPAQSLATEVSDKIRTELNFRAEVTVVPAGTLPRSEMKARRLVRKMT